MMNKEDTLEWLRRRTKEYRSLQNDAGEVVNDLRDIGKVGSGFVSVDELYEIDIGSGE
jgi:hypothetical protein